MKQMKQHTAIIHGVEVKYFYDKHIRLWTAWSEEWKDAIYAETRELLFQRIEIETWK